MKEIATDLYLLRGFPPAGFNIYLIRSGERWLLVDTSTKYSAPANSAPATRASSKRSSSRTRTGITPARCTRWRRRPARPCGQARLTRPRSRERHGSRYRKSTRITSSTGWRSWWTEHHPVSRRLRDGEQVAGFTVIEFPGHTPGQIGLWRESDRTVICADGMRSMNPSPVCPNSARCRRSSPATSMRRGEASASLRRSRPARSASATGGPDEERRREDQRVRRGACHCLSPHLRARHAVALPGSSMTTFELVLDSTSALKARASVSIGGNVSK